MTKFDVKSLMVVTIITLVSLLPSHSYSEEIPGKSLANKPLRAFVSQQLKMSIGVWNVSSSDRCEIVKIVDSRVSELPPKGTKKLGGIPIKAKWSEVWKTDQCGISWDYKIEFTTNGNGNVTLKIGQAGGEQNIKDCILPNGSKIATILSACASSGGKVVP